MRLLHSHCASSHAGNEAEALISNTPLSRSHEMALLAEANAGTRERLALTSCIGFHQACLSVGHSIYLLLVTKDSHTHRR